MGGGGSWNIYFILLSSFLSSSSPSYFILIFVCFPFLHSFSPQTRGARSKLKNISFCLYRFIFLSFLFYSIYFPSLSSVRSLSHSMWSCCFFVLLCYFIYYYFFLSLSRFAARVALLCTSPLTPSAPACLRLGLKCGFLSFSIYIHYYCCDCRDDDAAAAASAAHNFNFVSVSLYLPSVRTYVCVCVMYLRKKNDAKTIKYNFGFIFYFNDEKCWNFITNS